MLASRRARRGVTLVRLLAARVGRRWRNQALTLLRRERLVLGPCLAQILGGWPRCLDQVLVVLARLAALLGRELGPGLHAPLHALLLLRLHARIALGDGDPFLAALGLERLPVGLERREGLLLLGRELGPRRPSAGDGARRLGSGFRAGGRGGRLFGAGLARRLRRCPGGDAQRQRG